MASQQFLQHTDAADGGGQTFEIFSLPALEKAGFPGWRGCRISLKILLENLLRREDARFVDPEDIQALAGWDVTSKVQKEIAFTPARVLLQDFTGVPAVVDLAAMRDGIVRLGGDPRKVNPLQPVELVIDHSVQVDHYRGAQRRRPQRRARVRAATGALHVPALGPGSVPELPRRSARHRHRPPGQPRVPRARDLQGAGRTAPCSPTPTRSSAPTRTPRWSTGSASWAGASAASKPRPRCSASRSRC